MADKGKPKKTSKAAKSEAGVMGGLSATRPPRIGGRRRGGTPSGAAATDGAAKPAAKTSARGAAKPAAKRPAKAAAKTQAKAAAKSPAKAAAKSPAKAAAKRPAKAAAKSPAKAAGMPTTSTPPKQVREAVKPRRPRPVRTASPALERPAAEAARERAQPSRPAPASTTPSGTELVTTAIQAAGELAQIGVTVGGQILKRAIDRLPKP